MDLLPPEIILRCVAYLTLPDVASLLLVSKAWKELFASHEGTVFREAAVQHGFANPRDTLEIALRPGASPWLDDVQTWKELCAHAVSSADPD